MIALALTYILRYIPLAMSEEAKYGIPWQITIAQAVLEGDSGRSDLAIRANNHFGIKCHQKKCPDGHCIMYFDRGEGRWSKFRRFNTVWESYRAHSVKLAQEPQYAHLHGLDWRSYALGLEGIYSQDEQYAEKLIRIIENL